MIIYQSENSSRPYNCDVIRYDDFSYVAHLHRDLELVYVESGEIVMTVEGRTETVRAGEFSLVLPSRIHRYETPVHSRALVVVFSGDYVPEFMKLTAKKTAPSSVFTMLDSEKELLLRRLAEPQKNRLMLSALFSLATAAFLESVALTDSENESKGSLLLHRMLLYISEHYRENITLDSMARELGYESHYISRCFHTHLSKNFKEFVNEYRIHYAKHLISSPERMTMTEIAFLSGFQSVRNFNRVYKSIEGTEPRRHR